MIRTKVASLSDNRIRLMNEIIKGMQVIKMYAWERHFSNIISEARRSVTQSKSQSINRKVTVFSSQERDVENPFRDSSESSKYLDIDNRRSSYSVHYICCVCVYGRTPKG